MITKTKYRTNTSGLGLTNSNLEKYLNQVDGFFFEVNYNKHDNEYTFPCISNNVESLYGLSLPYVEGNEKSIFDLIHEDDREIVINAIRESRKKLTSWIQEFRLKLSLEVFIWVKVKAKPEEMCNEQIVWTGYASDITDFKNAQIELVNTKKRYEFALEGSEMGIWDWNIKENIVFYSDKSLSLLELSREEIEPHEDTWTNRVHPDDKEKYFEDIKDHFDGNTLYYAGQHRVFSSSGVYKWIQDRGKTVEWDSEGNPLRVIGTHEDITKMKEHEEIILEKNNLIESHNGRLKNFALIVSHNLRTHAGNLKTILQLIDDAESPDEKMELSSYLNDISKGLSGTINNLNDIASSNRSLSDTPKLIFINEYVEKTINNLQSQIKEKDAIVINYIPKDIQITYNAAYLESILFNLVSNAIKYSDIKRQPKITISAEITSAFDLIVSVADNGLGIDLEANGGKLFGLYNTFHRNEDSKGLGLFMTRNQIEDMGDAITVESTKGEGSTFSVHFKNKLP